MVIEVIDGYCIACNHTGSHFVTHFELSYLHGIIFWGSIVKQQTHCYAL